MRKSKPKPSLADRMKATPPPKYKKPSWLDRLTQDQREELEDAKVKFLNGEFPGYSMLAFHEFITSPENFGPVCRFGVFKNYLRGV